MPESFTHFITNNEEILQNCIPGNGLENFSMSVSGVRKHNVHKLKQNYFCWEISCNIVGFSFQVHYSKDHFSSAEVFYFGSIYIDRVGITRTPTEPLLAEKKMIFFFTHLKLKRIL